MVVKAMRDDNSVVCEFQLEIFFKTCRAAECQTIYDVMVHNLLCLPTFLTTRKRTSIYFMCPYICIAECIYLYTIIHIFTRLPPQHKPDCSTHSMLIYCKDTLCKKKLVCYSFTHVLFPYINTKKFRVKCIREYGTWIFVTFIYKTANSNAIVLVRRRRRTPSSEQYQPKNPK